MISDASTLTFDEPFVLICAFVVGTLAVTRITRLIVDDEFPPIVWLRERYAEWAGERWGVLVECAWCISVWASLPIIVWGWASGLHWTWWGFTTWMAVSWLAAFLTARDVPPDARE